MDKAYRHAIGRVRSIELKLLPMQKLDTIIGAENFDKAWAGIIDTPYAELASAHAFEIDELVEKALAATRGFINEIAAENKVIWQYYLQYDLYNLKVILKSKMSGRDLNKEELYEIGNYLPEALQEFVDKPQNLPKQIKPLIDEAAKIIIAADSLKIDPMLDKVFWNLQTAAAKKIGIPLFMDYVAFQIDLINLRNLAATDNKLSSENFVSGGKLKIEGFSSVAELAAKLKYSAYPQGLSEAVMKYQENKSAVMLEKRFDDLLVKMIKPAKYLSYGIEPVLGYLIAKEVEIKNIRSILIGKLRHIPENMIQKALRMVYV